MSINLQKTLKDSPSARWAVLLLLSFSMSASYYFYDAVSPLKDLMEKLLHYTSTDYGLFVAAYSFPNVFLAMAVVGGIILDKIGIRITGIMFISSMFLGASLTAYGASEYFNHGGFGYAFFNSFFVNYSPALKVMSLGFFLFGLGSETSCVVISKAVVKWFNNSNLTFAMALNVAIARIGTGSALIISPIISAHKHLTLPIAFGALLMALGLIAFLVYCVFDSKLDKQTHESVVANPEEQFKISDVAKLLTDPSYLFLVALCVTFYSAVFPFMKFAPDLMQNKFGVDSTVAGMIVSILPFGTILFTPLFGNIIGKKGHATSVMILGSVLLVVVHLMFAFLPTSVIFAYIPMCILGIAFSLVPAAMWPALAKIVPEYRLGTAYGLTFTIQNIGLMIFPYLIGLVLEKTNVGVTEKIKQGIPVVYDYTYTSLMLAVLGVAGMLFAFLLKRADKKSGYGLELPNEKQDDK